MRTFVASITVSHCKINEAFNYLALALIHCYIVLLLAKKTIKNLHE